MSGGGGSQVTGYEYSFGIHMGLGRGPVDELVEIKVGDKTAWKGHQEGSGQIEIDKPNLFGGPTKEGGVTGTFTLMMGEPGQVPFAGLVEMLGVAMPGFRRMVTAFFNGAVCANNPYPKPWKFRVRRARAGWDGATFEPSTAVISLAPTDAHESELPPALVSMNFDNAVTETYRGPLPSAPGSYSLVIKEIETVEPAGANWQMYGYGGVGSYNTSDVVAGELRLTSSSIAQVARYTIPVDERDDWTIGIGDDFTLEVNHDCAGAAIYSSSSPAYIFATGLASYSVCWNLQNIASGGGRRYAFGSLMTSIVSPSSGMHKITVKRALGMLGIYLDDVLQQEAPSTAAIGAPTPVWAAVGGRNDGLYIIPNDFGNGIYGDFSFRKGVVTDLGISAMNPSHIIFECLTNREWGRGLDRSSLDTTAFTNCANTLFDEGFGLCVKWSRKDSIESFVQSILDHIGATLFTSRSTGLLTLKLIRADYTFDDLPLFDMNTGLLEVTDSAVSAPGGGANQIVVTWHDPVSDTDRTVKVDNLASIQAARGAVNTMTKNYPGIPCAALALRVAQRDLRVSSTTLRRFTLHMDRRAWKVEPGAVIRIKDLSRGIRDTAVRVGRVEDGTLTSGRMTITAIQDVFTLPVTPFSSIVPNTWVPPNNTPCLDIHRVIEAPYFMVYKSMTASELAAVDPNTGFIGTMVAPGQPMNIGHEFAVRDSAPTSEDDPSGTAQFCGYIP